MNKENLYLILTWAVFYFLHSLLASNFIKKKVKTLKISDTRYRLGYNFAAVLTLLGAMYVSIISPSSIIMEEQGWQKMAGLLFAVLGVWITIWSFRYYNFRAFIGLREEKHGSNLQKKGLMRLTRHPIYWGTLLILIGYFLFSPTTTSLIILFVSILYIFIGIRLEETKLIQEFGEEYLEYKREVPMLVPFIRF